MQTVDDIEISYDEIDNRQAEPKAGLFERLAQHRAALIAVIFLLAVGARLYRLDAAGLSEDETNKVFAVRSYLEGDLTANAEHPMLVKLLCFASLRVAAGLNRAFQSESGPLIPDEVALRVPNALFGALSVVPLFLLAHSLFDFRVALVAGLLWALGVVSIWFNRIGKEDTLLVFFMLLAFYLYHCAKSKPAEDVSAQETYYALSGAAFGLMMASKYFPHYYGLNMLYYHLAGYDVRNNRPLTRRMLAYHFAALIGSFVAFNFVAFSPKTWRFNWAFVNEGLLTHHGYLLMDELVINEMSQTPGGNPWYFYLLFLGVKLPLPVLVAVVVGALAAFRFRPPHPWARGALLLRVMFILWLGPMSIAGAKWSRYILALMPFAYIAAGVGVLLIWRGVSRLVEAGGWLRLRGFAGAGLAGVFVAAPVMASLASLPYPSLYLNALGGGRVGYFFSHDEFYDMGARESILYIAQNAPRGAAVASEIPGVLEYYLDRYGRRDIRSLIISHPQFGLAGSTPHYVILQRGRLYLENRDYFKFVENSYPVVQESKYRGAVASRVYEVRNSSQGNGREMSRSMTVGHLEPPGNFRV